MEFANRRPKQKALKIAATCSSSEEFTIKKAAHILRRNITNLMKAIPDLPTSLNFQTGQVDPPDILIL